MANAPGQLFKFEISQARNIIVTQGAFTSVLRYLRLRLLLSIVRIGFPSFRLRFPFPIIRRGVLQLGEVTRVLLLLFSFLVAIDKNCLRMENTDNIRRGRST